MSGKDLVHHYKVLKQFLDISDDLSTRTKTNSSRAARAREKLLKLSEAQFKELSTDVYDELKRRIDESRGEPDFLLPKSSFHPKRNQARQKLSSLPQSRFKDLVSDISFEIERRNLHVDPTIIIPRNMSTTSYKSNNEQERHESIDKKDSIGKEANEIKQSVSSNIQNQTIGVQSKTVVPTKANLTWSSDEEEDQTDVKNDRSIIDKPKQDSEEVKHLLEESSKMGKMITDLKSKLSIVESEKQEMDEKYRLLQEDYDYSMSQNKSLSEEIESLHEEKKNWLSKNDSVKNSPRSVNKDDEILKEFEALRATNAALRLENQSLKNANSTTSKDLVSTLQSKNTSSRDIDLNSSPSITFKNNMKKDMETFFEKLSNLDATPVSNRGSAYAQLRNDVAKWQKKYEELRSNNLSNDLSKAILTKEELKSFVSPSGLISIKLVSDFQSLVESFLMYLNGSSFDSDILFDKISKISILVNEIATQGDNQQLNSNEHSIFLREAVSYVLTATRYYAVYSNILPKIIIERALGEVCFTLCDLITVSKLNSESSHTRAIEPVVSNSSSKIKNIEEDFGVRPLRMANRLRESQNQSNLPANDIDSPFQSKDATLDKRSVSASVERSMPFDSLSNKKITSPVSSRNMDTPTKSQGSSSRNTRFDSPTKKNSLINDSENSLSKNYAHVTLLSDMGLSSKDTILTQEYPVRKESLINLTMGGVHDSSNISDQESPFREESAANSAVQSSSDDVDEVPEEAPVEQGSPVIGKVTNGVLSSNFSQAANATQKDTFLTDATSNANEQMADLESSNGRAINETPTKQGSMISLRKVIGGITFKSSSAGGTRSKVGEGSADNNTNIYSLNESKSDLDVAPSEKQESYVTPKRSELEIKANISSPSKNFNDYYSDSYSTPIKGGRFSNGSISNDDSPKNYESTYEKNTKSKNISALASKFEQINSTTEKPATRSPKSKSPSIALLASKLNTSSESLSQKSSPTRATPTKRNNIFDRVRQFETPEEDKRRYSPSKSSPAQSVGNKRTSIDLESDKESNGDNSFLSNRESIEINNETKTALSEPFEAIADNSQNVNRDSIDCVKDEGISKLNEGCQMEENILEFNTTNHSTTVFGDAPVEGIVPNIVKGRDLSPSIRDKLTIENEVKINDDVMNADDGSLDNDKVETSTEKMIVSTAETTPSNDDSTEIDGDLSQNKGGNGFFQSIRNKFAHYGEDETDELNPNSSATSNTTIQDDKGMPLTKDVNGEQDDAQKSIKESQPDLLLNSPTYKIALVNVDKDSKSSSADNSDKSDVPKSVTNSSANESTNEIDENENDIESTRNSYEANKVSIPDINIHSENSNEHNNYQRDFKTYEQRKISLDESVETKTGEEDKSDYDSVTDEESEAKQRQEYRKSMAAATFNVDLFDIDDPDNTLTQVLLYLEHQTVQVIATIQSLLSAIKKPDAMRGELREKSKAITVVISQMTEATNTSMNQTRNAQLKEHGNWVVKNLEDCYHRMNILCKPNSDKSDSDFADKNFKQRLAGISFDIAKCTKELVKTVEEASLKEDIAHINARLSQADDLT